MPIDPPSAPGGRRTPPRTASGELEMWRARALSAERAQRDLEQITGQNEERRRLEHEDFLRSIDRRIRDCVAMEVDRILAARVPAMAPPPVYTGSLHAATPAPFMPMTPPVAFAPMALPVAPPSPDAIVMGGGHAPPGMTAPLGAAGPFPPMRPPAATLPDVQAYGREVRAERNTRLVMGAIPVLGGLVTLIVSTILSHCEPHAPAYSTSPVPSLPALPHPAGIAIPAAQAAPHGAP